jgi:hypothetical protein
MEFLTHKTTCASEMLEKTTCQKNYQKRPPAAWANAGRCVTLPPSPLAASTLPPSSTLYKLCINFRKKTPAKPHAGFGCGGTSQATCRLWMWRQGDVAHLPALA